MRFESFLVRLHKKEVVRQKGRESAAPKKIRSRVTTYSTTTRIGCNEKVSVFEYWCVVSSSSFLDGLWSLNPNLGNPKNKPCPVCKLRNYYCRWVSWMLHPLALENEGKTREGKRKSPVTMERLESLRLKRDEQMGCIMDKYRNIIEEMSYKIMIYMSLGSVYSYFCCLLSR